MTPSWLTSSASRTLALHVLVVFVFVELGPSLHAVLAPSDGLSPAVVSWVVAFAVASLFGPSLVVRGFERSFLVLWLSPDRVRSELRGGAEAASSKRASGVLSERLADLEGLGFRPIGTFAERIPFARRTACSHVLALDDLPSIEAHVLTNFTTGEGAYPFFLYTPFEDGAGIMTTGYEREPIEATEYLRAAVPGGTPRAVLARHREQVRRFLDQRHRPIDAPCTAATIVASGQARLKLGPVRRELRGQGLAVIARLVGSLAALAAAFAWALHW